MRRVGIGLFVLAALGGGVVAREALAGLPGVLRVGPLGGDGIDRGGSIPDGAPPCLPVGRGAVL
jgi:hypothetical protein